MINLRTAFSQDVKLLKIDPKIGTPVEVLRSVFVIVFMNRRRIYIYHFFNGFIYYEINYFI